MQQIRRGLDTAAALHKLVTDSHQDAGQAIEAVNPRLERQAKALHDPRLEVHLDSFFHGRQVGEVELPLQGRDSGTGEVGEGSQREEHAVMLLENELASLGARGKSHDRHRAVGQLLHHAIRVGYPFVLVLARTPRGVQPPERFDGQDVFAFLQKIGRIVCIVCQRHYLSKLLHARRNLIAHDLAAQLALAEQVDLLHQQALLDLHELLHTQIDESAVLVPDLFSTAFAQKLQCGCHLSPSISVQVG